MKKATEQDMIAAMSAWQEKLVDAQQHLREAYDIYRRLVPNDDDADGEFHGTLCAISREINTAPEWAAGLQRKIAAAQPVKRRPAQDRHLVFYFNDDCTVVTWRCGNSMGSQPMPNKFREPDIFLISDVAAWLEGSTRHTSWECISAPRVPPAPNNKRRVIADFPSGVSLLLEVATTADLDGEFIATCCETGEKLRVSGWTATIEEVES